MRLVRPLLHDSWTPVNNNNNNNNNDNNDNNKNKNNSYRLYFQRVINI